MNLIFCAMIMGGKNAQEMLGDCLTCEDKKLKCELDCFLLMHEEPGLNARDNPDLLPAAEAEAEARYYTCLNLCEMSLDDCSDSERAIDCQNCAFECAENFDGSVFECVQRHNEETYLTYGKDLDECVIAASSTMEKCRSVCSPLDLHFFGWTPHTEDGTATKGDQEVSLESLRDTFAIKGPSSRISS